MEKNFSWFYHEAWILLKENIVLERMAGMGFLRK